MYLYSGYVDSGHGVADYKFEHEEELDDWEQLEWLLNTGTIQIIANEPQEA
jgi:hypothetical protein